MPITMENAVKINGLFEPELVEIIDGFPSKAECLEYLCSILAKSGCLNSPKRFLDAVNGREDIMSTGIGKGVAIPHARDLSVSCLKAAVCLLRNPLDFQSVDDLPVHLVFMIAVPQNSGKEYMKVLRAISEHLREDANRQALINTNNPAELHHEVLKIQDLISGSLDA
ncbi:MAG: PTS sugar transporter subunit IIA [Candidatus Cloacimonadaceae bacterium]